MLLEKNLRFIPHQLASSPVHAHRESGQPVSSAFAYTSSVASAFRHLLT